MNTESTADQFSMRFCCDITTNPNLTTSLSTFSTDDCNMFLTCFVDKVMAIRV